MENSQSTPQQPENEPDVSAGAVDALEAGGHTPSPGISDATAPPPAPEAPDGVEVEAPGEENAASEDPAPDLAPRVAELESQLQKAAEDLATLTAERDRLATESEAASTSHASALAAIERERDEARESLQATQAKLNATVDEWGLQMTRAKILKEFEGEEFIGNTAKERETVAFDLTTLILARLQATRDDRGDWDVRGKDGTPYEGNSGTRVIEHLCDRYSYLFKNRRVGGSGMVGQDRGGYYVQPSPRPGSLEAIAARMKALRSS